MTDINPQARELNETIKKNSQLIYELLSQKGKAVFFPKKGILAQGAEAKDAEINATLGTAWTDDHLPMVLPSVSNNLNIDPKDAFPYASSYGVPKLRSTWKDQLYKKNPSMKGKPISTPVVTCALTHGLSMMGYLFVDDNDEIILPNLFWGNYNLVFKNAYGARFTTFNFFKDGQFDIDSFKDTIYQNGIGKKIIILNFPNNPSGYSPTLQAAEKIKEVLKEAAEAGNKLAVLFDDAYFGLCYDKNNYNESLFAETADLHANLLAVKIDGITKEEFAWGFRVGFVTYGIKGGNEELYKALEDKTAGAVRGNISNAPHLSQTLILQALTSDNYQKEKETNNKKLEERFHLVKEILEKHTEYKEYFEALPFNAGYFMCVQVKKHDAETIRRILLEKYSTGLIAINDLLRVAYSATPTGKLEQLFQNIYLACKGCEA